MPDPSSSTALDVRRDAASVGVPLPPMADAELASLWRTAKALAESRLFKDAQQAGQAFAKMLAGRDLGLTPFESMSSLHVVEGKVEASSDLHATRVRERDGFDFRVAWLKLTATDEKTLTDALSGRSPVPPAVEAVWADLEALEDLRPVFGCVIVFEVGGEQRGVSRFTIRDARVAGLVKDRSAWEKFPRNMFYARAMTNGVAWFVPEVMGGVRVYGAGELTPGLADGEDLTAAAEPTSEPVKLDDLPTAVEAVIARAHELGHVGLQNRAAAAMAIGGRGEYVDTWIRNATAELNRMAAGREPEPVDAEVVCAVADPATGATCELREGHDGAHRTSAAAGAQTWDVAPADTGAVSAEGAQTPDPTSEADGGAEDAPAAGEAGDPLDTPEGRAADAIAESFAGDPAPMTLDDRIESCRESIRQAEHDGDDAARGELVAELAELCAEREAQQNPDQSSLL